MPRLPLALLVLATPGVPAVAEPALTPAIVALQDLARRDLRTPTRFNLCGMFVRARARQPDGATHEWDLAVSVFRRGPERVAGVEAAAFAYPRDPADRVVRAPLAELTLSVEDPLAAATARMVSGPNADGGMVGELAAEDADWVFAALDSGRRLRLGLNYVDGSHETVLLRTHGGALDDPGYFPHGRDAPVRACLARLVPATAPLGPVFRTLHPR